MGIFSEELAKLAPVDGASGPDTIPNSLRKGWDSGMLGAGSQLHSVAGLVGEAVGADEFAKNRAASSLRLRGEAEQAAPQVGRWDQVHGLRDFGNYAAGLVGGSAPISLAGMGAAALTGGGVVPGILAAGAATAPFEIGDVIQKQEADPEAMQHSAGERLGSAVLGGGASALAQGVVPGIIGKQLGGLTAARAAKESFKGVLARNLVGDAALEGVAEGGGDVIKQYAANPNRDIDWDSVKENAIGGAVAGGAMGGVGVTGDLVHRNGPMLGNALSSARTSINDRLAKMKGAADEKIDAAAETAPGKKVKGAFDDISDMLQRGKAKFDDTVDKVLKGEELGINPQELATATSDRVKEMFDFSDNEKVKAATKWGKEMLDDVGLDAAKRQEVTDALNNVKDRTGQVAMAGLKKAWDVSKAAGRKIEDLANSISEGYDEYRRGDVDVDAQWVDEPPAGLLPGPEAKKPTINERKAFIDEQIAKGATPEQARTAYVESLTKKSEDYSGVHKVIADTIRETGIVERRPELFDSTNKVNIMADALRKVMEQMSKGPVKTGVLKKAARLLGNDAVIVLSALKNTLKYDVTPEETEQFFGNISALMEVEKNDGALLDVMRDSMVEQNKTHHISDDADVLIAHARGMMDPDPKRSPGEIAVSDRQINEYYEQTYGKNADKVRAAVEKAAGYGDRERQEGADRLDENGALVDTTSEGGFDESGNRLTPGDRDRQIFGLTKPNTGGKSKSQLNGRAMHKDDRYVQQHMLDLRQPTRNGRPNEFATVDSNGDYVYEVRFEQLPGSEFGHIVVEKYDHSKEFNETDLQAMELDTHKYPNSPSRIDAGGYILDAVKIASTMRNKLQGQFESGPTTAKGRLAAGFQHGLSLLMNQFGERVDVANAAVIGYVNGKPLTWGEAQKLDKRTLDDKANDAVTQDLTELRLKFNKAKEAGANSAVLKAIQDEYKDLMREQQAARDEELSRGDDIHSPSRERQRPSDLQTLIGRVRNESGYTDEVGKGPGREENPNGQTKDTDGKLNADIGGNIHELGDKSAPVFGGNDKNRVTRKPWGKVDLQGDPQIDRNLKSNAREIKDKRVDLTPNDKNVHRSNMDGSGHFVSPDNMSRNNLVSAIVAWDGSASAMAAKIKARAEHLLNNFDKMSKADQRRFVSIAPEDVKAGRDLKAVKFAPKSLAEAAPIVNDLARKYKDVIVPPGEKGESVKPTKGPIEKNPVRFDREGRVEGQPDPKPVAVKKAAFLERAASGDKALIKELSTSDDAKGLQRAIGALAEAHPYSEAMKAATARLSELVKDPDVAYGLQTTKYSLESVRVHNELGRDGFAAAHDSPHKFDGVFNWEANSGRGEGGLTDGIRGDVADGTARMAGAGTYLSTSEGSHRGYKARFTGVVAGELEGSRLRGLEKNLARAKQELGFLPSREGAVADSVRARIADLEKAIDAIPKSPTYHVSVDIRPEQLLDWNKPLSEQSDLVQEALGKAGFKNTDFRDDIAAITSQITNLNTRLKNLSREEQTHFEETEKWHEDNPIESAMGERNDPRDDRLYWINERNSIHTSLLAAKQDMQRLQAKAAREQAFGDGGSMYRSLVLRRGSEARASIYLRSLGILGNVHDAQGGHEINHRNYVIYDDSKITTNYVHFSLERTGVSDFEVAKYDLRTALERSAAPIESAHLLEELEKAKSMEDLARIEAAHDKIFEDWSDELWERDAEEQAQEAVNWAKFRSNFDRSGTNPNKTSGPNRRLAVERHIEKVLDKSVRVAWRNFTYAGQYTHTFSKGLIELSVRALDPMSTAYHESLHAFFGQLRDAGATDITKVLEKAASSQHVIEQLRERYKNQPEVLKQLADPEERAAYMYQTWASDPTFKINIGARGVFAKIKDFIAHLMGAWTNDERALHIMNYFHSGEYAQNMSSPSGVRAALMNSHRSQILETAKSFAEPLGQLADAVVGTGGARLRDTGIPALGRLADIMKREHTTRGGDQGFIQASRVEATKMRTQLGVLLEPYTKEQLRDAMEALHSNTPATSPEARLAVRAIKGFLRGAHGYMTSAGVNIGNLGPDYFPRVWDTHYISKNQQAFRDMLEPYIRRGEMKGSADELIHTLTSRNGVELGIESREPGMQFKKERKLDFITAQDAAQFVEKDLMGTLSSYINQAARKAEWTRRLGGGKLESLMDEAKQQGATKEHIELAETYMKGIDGTLGDDLNPTARRIMGDMIVYQNVRLLPTAAFSMLIDPNGVLVRGGTVGDAWSTFKRGMAGIKDTFKKDGGGGASADQATKWAELVGVVDSAMMSHVMGDVFSQGMVGGTAQKINNAFFKYNFVEGLNRNFRIGATEAAIKFLARHAGGLDGSGPSAHSERWMKELGLQKGDIKLVGTHIALTELEGLQAPQVRRVHAAINQWVDGAVLRPDASDRPIWMNDPHYALISHLKQFVFSFQKTILERVVHEFRNGNYTPMMALASYVPIMMAADFAKGLLVTGGDTPEWQKGWTPADYLEYGVERAGLLGVGQFGMDVAKNIHRGGLGVGALTGPTIEQFGDIVSTLGGHKQFGNTVIDALPANTFVKGWSGRGESKADPIFAD